MRLTFVKWIALVALGIGSCWITSSLYGRPRNPEPATATTPQHRAGHMTVTDTPGIAPRVRRASDRPVNPVAHFKTVRAECEPLGQSAAVSMAVNMYDTRENMKYIWSIELIDQFDDTRVFKHFYHDQVFSVVPGRPVPVTFDELVELEDGDYFVQVALYSLPSSVNPIALQDDEFAASQSLLKMSRDVVIR